MRPSKEDIEESVAWRGRVRFSPADLNVEVYNAVMDCYSRDRSSLDRDPYLLAELLLEVDYLLVDPPVDIVIHAQDLIRSVER